MINNYYQRHSTAIKTVLIILSIIGFIALIYYLGIDNYISLEHVQKQSASIKHAVAQDYMASVIYFLTLYVVLITCALPVVGPLTILGGYLFGLLPGFLYSLTAACVGSLISFLCIRYLLSSLVRNRYKVKLERFNQKIKTYGFTYLLTLQLLTVFPYVVINTLAALTDVPLIAFIWTTIVGSAPLIFIYALAGRQLGTLQSLGDILSPSMLLLLILLAGLALVPMIFKRFTRDEV